MEGPEQGYNSKCERAIVFMSRTTTDFTELHLFRIPAHQQRQIQGHDSQDVEGSVTLEEGEQTANQPFALSDQQERKELLSRIPTSKY